MTANRRGLRSASLRSARSLRSLAKSAAEKCPIAQKKRKRSPGMHFLRASQPTALFYGEGEPLPLPLALPCPLRPKAVAPLHHSPLISFALPPAMVALSSALHPWPLCREKMDGDFFSISPTLIGIAIHFIASVCPADEGQRGNRCRRRCKGGGE